MPPLQNLLREGKAEVSSPRPSVVADGRRHYKKTDAEQPSGHTHGRRIRRLLPTWSMSGLAVYSAYLVSAVVYFTTRICFTLDLGDYLW